MNGIITVRGLTKSFADGEKKVTALNGVDLTVYEGDIFGVIGLSGAGKSTFVRCLNRLEEPDEGSIIINGQDVREEDTFPICLNSYRASGTGGYDCYVGCPVVREIGTEMSDLILDYFKQYGDAMPERRGDFQVLPPVRSEG